MLRLQGLRRLALAMAAPLIMAAAEPAPVTVFEAAKIITMEPSAPTAKFAAVSDGIVLGVADTLDELKPWTDGREVTVDRRFAKAILTPGLIDPHIHPMQAAVMLNMPFIAPDDWSLPDGEHEGAQTPEAYRQKLRAELARSTADPFITWGHHVLFHGPIDRAELDQIAPDRAVVVWQRSFHEVIMNSAALAHYKLDTPERVAEAVAAGGANPNHADLEKGVFAETALPVALAKMRPDLLTPAMLDHGMTALKQMMLNSGVTTTSDMATGIFAPFDVEAGLIKAAFDRPDAPARVMLMPIAGALPEGTDLDQWMTAVTARYASAKVRVDRRVKMFADGAFFAQNMRMNAPGYTDGHEGKWMTEPAVLRGQFQRFWDAGFDLHVHVNGDEGVDAVLDALDGLAPRTGQTVTLEHLGYATEAQARRIARAGWMVSAQPNYIRVLGDAYAEHGLGADRAAVMNRLGSLERKGVPLGLHSDFNMAPIDPLYLAWIAANRVTIAGHDKAPQERLSLDKAMRAITIEAAQVIGMDSLIGSIAAGKKADFTVLDKDPYAVGAKRLRDIKVEGVIFEGRYFPATPH